MATSAQRISPFLSGSNGAAGKTRSKTSAPYHTKLVSGQDDLMRRVFNICTCSFIDFEFWDVTLLTSIIRATSQRDE
eukprot:scaffold36730_cov34-Prasinocladus_malaysianus.AAC.1